MFTVLKIRCENCFEDHSFEVSYDYFPADPGTGMPEYFYFYPENTTCECGRVFDKMFITKHVLDRYTFIVKEIKDDAEAAALSL